MLQVTWKHGISLVIPFLARAIFIRFHFLPLAQKATTPRKEIVSLIADACTHHLAACIALKAGGGGEGSSASQGSDYCSEVGWQVSLQINILWMHIYGLASQVLTL